MNEAVSSTPSPCTHTKLGFFHYLLSPTPPPYSWNNPMFGLNGISTLLNTRVCCCIGLVVLPNAPLSPVGTLGRYPYTDGAKQLMVLSILATSRPTVRDRS